MHSCCSHKFPKHPFCGASPSKVHRSTPVDFPPAPQLFCFRQVSKTTPGTLYSTTVTLPRSSLFLPQNHRTSAPSHLFSPSKPPCLFPILPNGQIHRPPLSHVLLACLPFLFIVFPPCPLCQNSPFSSYLYHLPPLCTSLGTQRIHHQGENCKRALTKGPYGLKGKILVIHIYKYAIPKY